MTFTIQPHFLRGAARATIERTMRIGPRVAMMPLSNDLKDGKLSLEAYEKAVTELT